MYMHTTYLYIFPQRKIKGIPHPSDLESLLSFFFFSIHTTFFFVNSGESASSSNDIRVSGLRFRDFESGPGEGLGSEGWG
jgi:hypothetical protein